MTGPILLSQATFLLAHITNNGPVPLSPARPAFPRLTDPSRFPPLSAFKIIATLGDGIYNEGTLN